MDQDAPPPESSLGSRSRLDDLISVQRRAAMRAAIPFAIFLLVFPLLGQIIPPTWAWLILGGVVYPFTWLIAGRFVADADRAEGDK